MGVAHFNAHFDDVLFGDRGGIEQSATFYFLSLGPSDGTQSLLEAVAEGVVDIFFSILGSCTMLFKILILTVRGSSRLSQCIYYIEITIC